MGGWLPTCAPPPAPPLASEPLASEVRDQRDSPVRESPVRGRGPRPTSKDAERVGMLSMRETREAEGAGGWGWGSVGRVPIGDMGRPGALDLGMWRRRRGQCFS